ncbi:MAG: calcium-binding protein [Mesorhizobium sp.]|nr:calcium-binding protein [Mesorhizobium sp. INR15]
MRIHFARAILSIVFLSGCAADYINHYDGVTLASDDANKSNLMLQTVDPLNPNSQNTHIEGDGARALAVVNAYRRVASQSGGDLDCTGGKGNNPVVAGPVRITGADPNHLDGDHDGVGCE